MPNPDIPHLALPVRLTGSSFAAVEQGSDEEILGCAEAILRCPLGHRVERPDVGIRDQAFRVGGADREEMRAALTTWEPRAEVLIEEGEIDLEEFSQRLQVEIGGQDG